MMRHCGSPTRSSTSSAEASSPALPELSLDTSLQILHREEDISASSSSSVALSRAWLQDQEEGPEEVGPASTGLDAISTSGGRVTGFGDSFRFPRFEKQPVPDKKAETDLQEDQSLPSRPRTSRGLSGYKPFLSSSRTTSISSMFTRDGERPEDHSPPEVEHGVSLVSDTIHSAKPSSESPWTILLAPLQILQSSEGLSQDHLSPGSILLPLQASIFDQIQLLRSHLVGGPNSKQGWSAMSAASLFLDLSSTTGRCSNAAARFTPESWSLMFAKYTRSDLVLPAGPLPRLYRDTGLPIVATVRYAWNVPTRDASKRQGESTQDSNPWLTPSTSTSPIDENRQANAMAASRSFPGGLRIAQTKSSWPYSPTHRAKPQETDPQIHTTFVATTDSASPTSSKRIKLRPHSLAAAPRLGPYDPFSSPTFGTGKVPAVEAARYAGNASSMVSPFEGAEIGLRKEPSFHRGNQFLQHSSPQSFRSEPTTSPRSSTRPTSMRSSLVTSDTTAEIFGDREDSDMDLGSRFWTQLSSLGELVSRENKRALGRDAQDLRRDRRGVSISSTASDASVLDFSPLGILVPTEEVIGAPTRSQKAVSGDHVSRRLEESSETPLPLSSGFRRQETGLLGRRRAYSSMIPLTGWRAGDSDLRTTQGHLSANVSSLPQVLLINTGRTLSVGNLYNEPNDFITPTVTTFDGSARALSCQPSSTTYLQDIARTTESSCYRRNIWEDAIGQLKERMRRRNTDEPVSRRRERQSSDRRQIDVERSASLPAGTLATSSSQDDSSKLTVGHHSIESPFSPLSGLFYDHWVEQVDGEVNGDLGRRGSAFAT